MKFTIRDLLLLTVIVALAVGWWLDRRTADLHYAEFQESFHKEMSAFLKEGQYVHIKSPKGGWVGFA